MSAPAVRNERGVALLITLLVVVAVGAIALAAVMMTLNANLVTKNGERISILNDVALAGLEEGRSRINGNRLLYPTGGYTTLESNATVKEAGNTAIPKITRSTWVGPSGIVSGQYGIIGSVISMARDSFGNKVVRRLETNQESFAKFAYFTNIEQDTSGTVLSFLNNDQIHGPVHSNDTIQVASSGARFFDQVSTAAAIINGQANGTFDKPPLKSVPRIPMPTVADLNKLDSLANVGGTRFTGSLVAGSTGQALTRIVFDTATVTGSGVQGFFRVYQGTDADFVTANLKNNAGTGTGAYLELSTNCGDIANGTFLAAAYHDTVTAVAHQHGITTGTPTAIQKIARRDSSLITSSGTTVATGSNPPRVTRCYLGGDSILTSKSNGTVAGTSAGVNWPTTGHVDGGAWVQAPSAIRTVVAALPGISGRPDANYLFPLSRDYNSAFKGVISVQGKVVVSGIVHGRVTVAATGNVIFGDDVTYYQGVTRDCTSGDIIGYFSGQSDIISNNSVNSPQTLNNYGSWTSGPTGTFRSYGASADETIYGFFLTLRTFGAERYDLGDDNFSTCSGNNTGRGCLFTFGGIIEGWRGAVTQGTGGGYTGYVKRYSFDACGATDPPPYFPTTGFFIKNRFYELDPTHFDVAAWFAANQN
jgi:hypothetical protein